MQMQQITVESPAKLNWWLRVLDKRSDGFHNLETVFQELDWSDTLTFVRIDELDCQIEGFAQDIPKVHNLIYRVWHRLCEVCGEERVGGVRVTAVKRLPSGGGLGGGSSNAASALCALNRLSGLGLDSPTLVQLGSQLGSDVPFFLVRGCAVGVGRGTELTPVSDVHKHSLVLGIPPWGVSTAEAFRKLSERPRTVPRAKMDDMLAALRHGASEDVAEMIHNDFETVMPRWFSEAAHVLKMCGSIRVFLCGSGSTVAALSKSAEEARQILENCHASCLEGWQFRLVTTQSTEP